MCDCVIESERYCSSGCDLQITEIGFDAPGSEESSNCVSYKRLLWFTGSIIILIWLAGEALAEMHVTILARVHIRRKHDQRLHVLFFKASYHPPFHLASSHPPFIPLLPTIPSEELPETEEPPRRSVGPPLHTDCFICFKRSVMEKDKTESAENPAPPACEVIFPFSVTPCGAVLWVPARLSLSLSLWVNRPCRSLPLSVSTAGTFPRN